MRILLDTCTFLWVATDAPDLSPTARELFRSRENDAYFSPISAWEIAVKYSLRRLPLPQAPEHFIPLLRKRHAIEPLPLDEEAALYLARLPALHRDPFDRMLICQAIVSGLVILTPDKLISQYPVKTAW